MKEKKNNRPPQQDNNFPSVACPQVDSNMNSDTCGIPCLRITLHKTLEMWFQ